MSVGAEVPVAAIGTVMTLGVSFCCFLVGDWDRRRTTKITITKDKLGEKDMKMYAFLHRVLIVRDVTVVVTGDPSGTLDGSEIRRKSKT